MNLSSNLFSRACKFKRPKGLAVRVLFVSLCITAVAQSQPLKAQQINLSLQNASLEEALKEIKKQSGFDFVYTREQLRSSKPVHLQLSNATLAQALAQCFRQQPLTYIIEGKHIVIKEKPMVGDLPRPVLMDVTGRVSGKDGEPLSGVTVSVKGTSKATVTNMAGRYVITDVQPSDVLRFTSIGYEPEELLINSAKGVNASMKLASTNLDETIIVAYGTTTTRLNTGSVTKVSAKEIESQPVSNPLAALQGRVPGLVVTQSSGVPGASFKVQIRGQNSILSGSNPLFIIDGVPFAPGNSTLSQLISAAGTPTSNDPTLGISPFSMINPSDIESIEVLKDADATAIYGSRGANGVVLITTKKAKPGELRLTLDVNKSWAKVSRTMDWLNTNQYLEMRREAFQNDGITPNLSNAYDLLLWDTTRYTDFKKLLVGGTAKTENAQLTVSNGTLLTHFVFGGGYHHETTVFPGDMGDRRITFHSSVNHKTYNKKINLLLTANYSSDNNSLIVNDLTNFLLLPPNYPALYDSLGNLRWEEKGEPFYNPMGFLKRTYLLRTDYLMSNFQGSYSILPNLTARISAGFNTVNTEEQSLMPKSSLQPGSVQSSSANFANSAFKSWVVEPQVDYNTAIGKLKLLTIAGATLQDLKQQNSSISATGFPNDALINSANAASELKYSFGNSHYRYAAVFGRINLNFNDQYILNFSGRHDGSSRFGDNNQVANYGSVGGAWIFSQNKWFANKLKALSFGKLRGSIGITGNDQIGNYQYHNNWVINSNSPYNGVPGLNPIRLHNPDLAWETNRKMEGALEMGLFKNRVYLTVAYFTNQSGNQLINYNLPVQTGFTSMLRNWDAVVRNSGWELSGKVQVLSTSSLKWIVSANISIPKNRLISFPGLMSSSYANQYREGQSLSLLRLYQFSGVDPQTGVYQFTDIDRSGTLTQNDRVISGHLDPKYYGGLSHSLQFKNWNLEFFFEVRNQRGGNYLTTLANTYPPGMTGINQPVAVLNRWRAPGQITDVQRFTTGPGTAAFTASVTRLGLSSAAYDDASFVRLKNLALSYALPEKLLTRAKIKGATWYLRCQNLFTITSYKGADPERQNLNVLPPLRVIATGIQFTF